MEEKIQAVLAEMQAEQDLCKRMYDVNVQQVLNGPEAGREKAARDAFAHTIAELAWTKAIAIVTRACR